MKSGLKVYDAMTREPVTISSNATIVECAKKMRDEKVGSMLIVDKGKLAGILTEQDMVFNVLAGEKNPKDARVKDIMTTDVVTISPDEDINDAILKMSDLDVRRLPVMEGDELLGILTIKDVLKVEPQLFELIADKLVLREEKNKPINKVGDYEGICELCGNYAPYLFELDESLVCRSCRDN